MCHFNMAFDEGMWTYHSSQRPHHASFSKASSHPFSKASSHPFSKASSHPFSKASSHPFSKASPLEDHPLHKGLPLRGTLIGDFPHSTQGNTIQMRGVFTGQFPSRWFFLWGPLGRGGGGVCWGPSSLHVPFTGHLK